MSIIGLRVIETLVYDFEFEVAGSEWRITLENETGRSRDPSILGFIWDPFSWTSTSWLLTVSSSTATRKTTLCKGDDQLLWHGARADRCWTAPTRLGCFHRVDVGFLKESDTQPNLNS